MDTIRPPAQGRYLVALACVAACVGLPLPVAAQERTDASLPDETASAQAKAAPPPAYGPVLTRRPADKADAANAAAAVRDETDIRTPAAATPASASAPAPAPAPAEAAQPARQGVRAAHRHSSLQGAQPLAPRPLRPAEGETRSTVPIPAPVTPPQPVVPSSTVTGPCPGGVCVDAAGNTLSTGRGAVGVNNGGHVCVRGTATVNCF